jgi:hypothetical protein
LGVLVADGFYCRGKGVDFPEREAVIGKDGPAARLYKTIYESV